MLEQIPRGSLKPQQNNIFGLEVPTSYNCIIERYKTGHPAMWLRIYKGEFTLPNDELFLMFTGVSFYEGPMQWVGANFRVAPRDEWLTLMQELGWIEGATPDAMDYLSEELRLFTVESQRPKYKIRIVAANAHKSHNRPEGFGGD